MSDEVVERIKGHLAAAPAVLFMKGTPDFPQCGFSSQATQALRRCGAKFHSVNIFEDPDLREALKAYSNWPTYPQLYVQGELVGDRCPCGATDVDETASCIVTRRHRPPPG